MPTVFTVLLHECKRQNRQIPNEEKRIILGKSVAAHYHELKIQKRIFRTPQKEFGKDFLVLFYPMEFLSEMKKMVLEFLEDQPFVPAKKIQSTEINKIL